LDGTLLDSHGIYCDLVNDIAPAFGLASPEYEVLQANFHGTLDESILNAFEGRLKEDQLKDFVEHFLDKQDDKYIVKLRAIS
jgi:phosphoglycolate phosphatase-like HAD superfamily hydrolase